MSIAFENVRTALLLGYDHGYLPEDEYFFTMHIKKKNPSYPYWEFDPFCLDDFHCCECEAMFGVRKNDIPVLVNALRLPEKFRCSQRTTCSGIEGLCILLKR